MADQFPCPNPACSHAFSAAALQTNGPVSCPRCGFRLQGRGSLPAPVRLPTPPVKPAPPVATPMPPKPVPASPPAVATPVPAAAPIAAPRKPPTMPAIDVDLVASPPRGAPVAAPKSRPASPIIGVRPPVMPPAALSSHEPSTPSLRRSDAARALTRVLVVLGALGASACLVSAITVFVLVQFRFFTFDELLRGEAFHKQRPRLSDYLSINGKVRTIKGAEEQAYELHLLR